MTKQPSRSNKIRSHKAVDQVAWQNLDADLSQLLELALKGSTKSKFNSGYIIFKVCWREPTVPRKGMREKEIDHLEKARHQQLELKELEESLMP